MLRLFRWKQKKTEQKSKPAITIVPNSFSHINSGTGLFYDVGAVRENLPSRHQSQALDTGELDSLPHPLRSNPPPDQSLPVTRPSKFHNSVTNRHLEVSPVSDYPHANSATYLGIPFVMNETIDRECQQNVTGINHISNSKHFNRRPVSEVPRLPVRLSHSGEGQKPRPNTIGTVAELFIDIDPKPSSKVYQGKWQEYMPRLSSSGASYQWRPLSNDSIMSDVSHIGWSPTVPGVSPCTFGPIWELPGSVIETTILSEDVPVELPALATEVVELSGDVPVDINEIPDDLIAELTEVSSQTHIGEEDSNLETETDDFDWVKIGPGVKFEQDTAKVNMLLDTNHIGHELKDKADIPGTFFHSSSSSSLVSVSKWIEDVNANNYELSNRKISTSGVKSCSFQDGTINIAPILLRNDILGRSSFSATSSDYDSLLDEDHESEIWNNGHENYENADKGKVFENKPDNLIDVHEAGAETVYPITLNPSHQEDQNQFKLSMSSHFSTSFNCSEYFENGLKRGTETFYNCAEWHSEVSTGVTDFESKTALNVFATKGYHGEMILWTNPWINASPITLDPSENPHDVDVEELRRMALDTWTLEQSPSPRMFNATIDFTTSPVHP